MKEGFLMRSLIVALPAGLMLSGILAVMNSHFNQDEEAIDPNELVRLEAAAINRQPVNRTDLEQSLKVLKVRIGERHLHLPEKLESAAVWIESTLGQGNIGYLPERQSFEVGGIKVRNIIAELPGRERRDEIIVVATNYDTVPDGSIADDSASSVAALIALAKAFAGDQQGRTIRFVALVNGDPRKNDPEETGNLVYTRASQSKGERIVAMLNMELSGTPSAGEKIVSFAGNEASRFFVDSAASTFRRATGIPTDDRIQGPGGQDENAFEHEPTRQAGIAAVLVKGRLIQEAGDPVLQDLEAVTQGLKEVLDVWANP